MAGGVREAHLLVLALNFHQQRPDAAQQADAYGMVVDEGAGATVLGDDPAQHDLVFGRQTVLFQHGGHRMIVRRREACGDAGLFGGCAHQASFRPRTKGQAEAVEQDGFAGAGLAGQDSQARVEGQVQPFDQHDVADRQRGQHVALLTLLSERRSEHRMPGTGEEAGSCSVLVRRFVGGAGHAVVHELGVGGVVPLTAWIVVSQHRRGLACLIL